MKTRILAGLLAVPMMPAAAAADPRLEFAYAVLEQSRGEDASAADRFEKARLEDPLAIELATRGADRRMADGDRAGAAKLLRDLADARPDEVAVQFIFVDFLQREGGGDSLAAKQAIGRLERILEKHPGDPQVIRRLFAWRRATGDPAGAAALLGRLEPADPAAMLAYAALFATAFDPTDPAARAELDRRFEVALAAHPDIPELARVASEHFRNTDRLDRAIAILRTHAIAAAWSLDLRTRLGILEFSAKRDAEGEDTLKQVIAIRPKSALAHQALAKFYRLRGNEEPARHHAAELLKIRGGSAAEFLKLGEEYLAADDPRSARLLLEKGRFYYPNRADLAVKLAIATRRDPATAAVAGLLFREAESAMGPDAKPDPQFLLESAQALLDQGQGPAGEDRLRRAIRAFPPAAKRETAAALRRLAGLWEAENRNLDAARSLRQRADSLAPPE